MCSEKSGMSECSCGAEETVACAHCGMPIEGEAATCEDCGEPVCQYCEGEGCAPEGSDEGKDTDTWGRYDDRRSIVIL